MTRDERSRRRSAALAAAAVAACLCLTRTHAQATQGGAADEFYDAHFHLTNYIQEGIDVRRFLEIMGTRVGRSTRRMRSLCESAMTRSPSGAIATPSGVSSCATMAGPLSPENPVPRS